MTDRNTPPGNNAPPPDGKPAIDPADAQPPKPVAGARKNLSPIFGTFCTTQAFALKAYKRGSYHVHIEAYMDDPIKKTWTVNKIVHMTEPAFGAFLGGGKERTRTSVHQLKAHLTFNDALDMLNQFEKTCRTHADDFTPLVPDPAGLGFKHFRAFAEREGYVFDISGQPHARPHAHALPPGASFDPADIAQANNNLQRPENEFDNNGPASRLPETHFLFEQFTRATHRYTMDDSLAQLRVLDIMDRIAANIETAHEKLQEYCVHYQELGQGGLISDAENALKLAGANLRQLKAYGVDTTDFDSFVLQCRITCHILHAEGLYDLMNKGKGDFAQNEQLFKERVTKAIEGFKQIDSSDRGEKTLQDMIVQTPAPEVPATITQFVKNYAAQREAYRQRQAPPQNAAPATGPKPPQKPPFKP